MAVFPKKEIEIAGLANNMIAGFQDNTEIYPAPTVDPVALQATLDNYLATHNDCTKAEAVLQEKIVTKNAALDKLTKEMRADINYAESLVGNDSAKLKLIGWNGRKPKTPVPLPGQVRSLQIKQQGLGWISLFWKSPSDGGSPSAYKVKRLINSEDKLEEVGYCIEKTIRLDDQIRGKELAYMVCAVNKAGEGKTSNVVVAVL